MRAQNFDVGFRDAGAAAEIFYRSENTVLSRFCNALRRFDAHTGKRGDRRQEFRSNDAEFLGVTFVEIDEFTAKAAEIHLPCELEDDERRALLGV